MGRTTCDPEVRYTTNGKAVASFNFAVNRTFDRENSDFFKCVAFGKTAEFAERYLRQGTKLVVEGRIQTGSYTNKDGQKVYTTDVVVENCEFAESKNSASDAGNYSSSRPEPTSAAGDGFMNIPDGVEDEGLPFN